MDRFDRSKFDEDDDIKWRTPDEKTIQCKDCDFRAPDRQIGKTLYPGSKLMMCDAYSIKPSAIMYKNAECPYYLRRED